MAMCADMEDSKLTNTDLDLVSSVNASERSYLVLFMPGPAGFLNTKTVQEQGVAKSMHV